MFSLPVYTQSNHHVLCRAACGTYRFCSLFHRSVFAGTQNGDACRTVKVVVKKQGSADRGQKFVVKNATELEDNVREFYGPGPLLAVDAEGDEVVVGSEFELKDKMELTWRPSAGGVCAFSLSLVELLHSVLVMLCESASPFSYKSSWFQVEPCSYSVYATPSIRIYINTAIHQLLAHMVF